MKDPFLVATDLAGLPRPVPEYRFHPTRKWRLDYAWPDHRLGLEVEGGVWNRGKHGRGSGIVKDIEKSNALACLGWRLLRVLPSTLLSEQTITMLRTALQ